MAGTKEGNKLDIWWRMFDVSALLKQASERDQQSEVSMSVDRILHLFAFNFVHQRPIMDENGQPRANS